MKVKLRTLMFAVAVLGILMGLVLPAVDALFHGPYASWFNHDRQRRADEAGLVGRPEKDVVEIMGPPTFHYWGDNDEHRTYNYAPCPYLPTAKFQVHCRDGVVIAVEQFDD